MQRVAKYFAVLSISKLFIDYKQRKELCPSKEMWFQLILIVADENLKVEEIDLLGGKNQQLFLYIYLSLAGNN